MPFIGSFSGSKQVLGHGAYHPGVITVDVSPSSSQGSVVATSTLSSTASGTQTRSQFLTTTAVSTSPRVAYDPFQNGTVTYSTVSVAQTGTISRVTGTTVYVSTVSGLSAGQPFYIRGAGASMGGGMYGTFYIITVGANYVTLASTYANWQSSTAVTFATSSAGDGSGYTWIDNQPTWQAAGVLPPGISMNTNGAVSGNYTQYGPSSNNGLNPAYPTGGVYSGGTNNAYQNYYAWQDQVTTYANQTNPTNDIFSVQIVVPYEFRQIITTAYVLGGYANSQPWSNVNRCTVSNDSNVDLPSGHLSNSQAYQMGCWSWNYSYMMGGNGSVSTASNVTLAWNMRTETSRTSNFNATWYDTINSDSCVQQEYYYAWITAGGASIREFNLSTETNNGTPANQTGAGSSASGGSHETYGIFNSANVAYTYATRTGAGRAGAAMSSSANNKILQNKNPNSYQWGADTTNNWRYTNFTTNSTSVAAGQIPGQYNANEENHTNGQDWGYCIGFYNGAHVPLSYKWIFASATGTTGTSNYQGQSGDSSGWAANRD
jgi:hypothetical protein